MPDCLWCDVPTGSADVLCLPCRAINDHPLYHCTVDLRHLPTLGDSCAECDYRARNVARNAPRIAEMKAIRAQHVADFHKAWPGMEYGKVLFGRMLDGAIKELEEG
jgi:hypothetical protein